MASTSYRSTEQNTAQKHTHPYKTFHLEQRRVCCTIRKVKYSKEGAGQPDHLMEKGNQSNFVLHSKINSSRTGDLNVKSKRTKLLVYKRLSSITQDRKRTYPKS